jgi:Arc/MetJ family transcription regulator
MRTTIDLPDDLHAIASSLARDRGCTLSTAVVDLLRRALGSNTRVEVIDRLTGFPLLASGRPVTTDDVRQLDDEE